jgi:mannose-6-phosphate isomerase-like protein (cupin superfamily)
MSASGSFFHLEERKQFAAEKLQKVALCASERMLFDLYCLLPGQLQKLHTHEGTDKIYVVQSGVATILLGSESRTLGPGHAAHAPPGVPHGVRNDSSEPVTLLVFQARTSAV